MPFFLRFSFFSHNFFFGHSFLLISCIIFLLLVDTFFCHIFIDLIWLSDFPFPVMISVLFSPHFAFNFLLRIFYFAFFYFAFFYFEFVWAPHLIACFPPIISSPFDCLCLVSSSWIRQNLWRVIHEFNEIHLLSFFGQDKKKLSLLLNILSLASRQQYHSTFNKPLFEIISKITLLPRFIGSWKVRKFSFSCQLFCVHHLVSAAHGNHIATFYLDH